MSFFAKVLNRAVAPGQMSLVAAVPKGAAIPVRRIEEEEAAQNLRRKQDEEEMQPLRRMEEEEEAQPLRRVEEEEEMQALRRAEEEEEAQPLRRVEEEEEMQALRRNPRAEDEMPPEPSPVQALRRDAMTPSIPGDTTPSHPSETTAPFSAFDAPYSPPAPDPIPVTPERPRVQIDQIDVVIQEDSPSASGGSAGDNSLSRDLSRRMRSTYLRGL